MADPFAGLRDPVTPIAPDHGFAVALRGRIERALTLPRGVRVSTTVTTESDPGAVGKLTPYLAVADARQALEWYADTFGARLLAEPIVMPDSRIGHAELAIGAAVLMVADAHPEIGVVAPEVGRGATVTLHLEVPDVDALAARAVDRGAELERPPTDNPYGRMAVLRDPFGHRWMLNSPPIAVPQPMRAGDIAYVSMWVADANRAASFFGDVLEWEYAAAPGGGDRQLAGRRPPHGIVGGQQRATLFLCFAVVDLEAAVARARVAGGQASEPRDEPYGRVADCVDDQGLPFALYQLSGDEPRPATNGTRPGDLAYVTLHVVDSARARAFYQAVLGWQFTPGRVEDGWGPDEVAPMTGMSGGHPEAVVVPMYRVDDLAAAVERVRAAGGSSTEPARQPYGLTAECVDDQGFRFYLGQL